MTRKGLVGCADKRAWNDLSGSDDTRTKLVSLSPTLAFSLLGTGAILDSRGSRPRYAVQLEVLRYFRGADSSPRPDRIEAVLRGLETFLSTGYLAFAHKTRTWFEGSRVPAMPVYVLYFIYHPEGTPQVWKLSFFQSAVLPSQARTELRNVTGDVNAAPIVDGQRDVVNELLTGKNPAFDDLRNSTALQRVWRAPGFFAISVDDAVDFARLLIRSSNERRVRSSSPPLVGPTCDCGLFRTSSGVSWLVRNERAGLIEEAPFGYVTNERRLQDARDTRTELSETGVVKGAEFERRVRKLARSRKVTCQVVAEFVTL